MMTCWSASVFSCLPHVAHVGAKTRGVPHTFIHTLLALPRGAVHNASIQSLASLSARRAAGALRPTTGCHMAQSWLA